VKIGIISPPLNREAEEENVKIKAGIVQFSPAWESPEESIKILDRLFEGKAVDTDLLIFPEMTLTGFTMHADKFAEEIDGISTLYFMNLAQRLKTHLFAGIIEKDGDNIYNSLVHFDNNGIITARYRKVHPFSYANEEKAYTAGDTLVITKTDYARIGLSICYDLRFPELYRIYGKERSGIMINIANWPVPRIDQWVSLLKARAIENQCFMIGVNRTGSDPKNNYNGLSGVIDPAGKEILLVENEEGIFTVSVDLTKVKETREAYPFLDDIKLI
jgi:predicted amidohydrolase